MAIVPLLVNLARELDSENRGSDLDHFWDDDFGYGLHPLDIFRPRSSALMLHPRRRYNPYDRLLIRRPHGRQPDSPSISPNIGKDGFQVCMDVSQFKPNELSVKTIDNNIIVEGKHEEREDGHGLIQRHFIRKYALPKNYDPKEVHSTISSDGVLTVKAAPPSNNALKQNERVVQIQQTGPAHMSVKQPEQEAAATTAAKATQAKNGSTEKMETGK